MRHAKELKQKSKSHEVEQTGDSSFIVTSGHSGTKYIVTLLEVGAACSCDWAKYRPAENKGRCGCSHVLAVMAYIQSEQGRTVSAFTSTEQAERQHRPIIDLGDGLTLTTRKAS